MVHGLRHLCSLHITWTHCARENPHSRTQTGSCNITGIARVSHVTVAGSVSLDPFRDLPDVKGSSSHNIIVGRLTVVRHLTICSCWEDAADGDSGVIARTYRRAALSPGDSAGESHSRNGNAVWVDGLGIRNDTVSRSGRSDQRGKGSSDADYSSVDWSCLAAYSRIGDVKLSWALSASTNRKCESLTAGQVRLTQRNSIGRCHEFVADLLPIDHAVERLTPHDRRD
jgi:hypothetical protein